MSAADNIVGFIRGFGQRKQAAEIKDQLKNYLTNPEAAIAGVNQIDPATGIALNTQHTKEVNDAADRVTQEAKDALALQTANQKRQLDSFGQVTSFLRAARDNGQTDMGAALDSVAPFAKTALGATDQDLANWKQTITSNPSILDALDTEGQKARAKLAGDVHVVGPGAALAVGGKVTYSQPAAEKYLQVPNASGGRDVIAVGGGKPGAPTGPITADQMLPMTIAQESGGDYTAKNATTGALGKYQVMPATGASLAKKLGMPWRPDMMTKTDPASQRYQDTIGRAAVQESVDASGGDPRAAFSHYYSGSPTAYAAPGNPKTAQYVNDMMGRMNGGAGGVKPVYQTQGKPQIVARHLSPQEVVSAGYPEGTVVEADSTGKQKVLYKPPVAKSGASAKGGEDPANVLTLLDNIQQGFHSLHDMKALPGDNTGVIGGVAGALNRSGVGQYIGEQLGEPSAQKRVEIAKNVSALQQAMLKSLPASATRTRFEQEMLARGLPDPTKMSLSTANTVIGQLKSSFIKALNASKPAAVAQAQAAPAANASPPVIGTRYGNGKGQFVEWNGKGWVPAK